MNKLLLILIATVCLPVFAAGQVVEEIITRVNGQIITRSEFQRSKDQLRDDVKIPIWSSASTRCAKR